MSKFAEFWRDEAVVKKIRKSITIPTYGASKKLLRSKVNKLIKKSESKIYSVLSQKQEQRLRL